MSALFSVSFSGNVRHSPRTLGGKDRFHGQTNGRAPANRSVPARTHSNGSPAHRPLSFRHSGSRTNSISAARRPAENRSDLRPEPRAASLNLVTEHSRKHSRHYGSARPRAADRFASASGFPGAQNLPESTCTPDGNPVGIRLTGSRSAAAAAAAVIAAAAAAGFRNITLSQPDT